MGAANLKADYWTALRRRAFARARAHTDHLMAPPALLCGRRRRPGRSARVRAIGLDRSERATSPSLFSLSRKSSKSERPTERQRRRQRGGGALGTVLEVGVGGGGGGGGDRRQQQL